MHSLNDALRLAVQHHQAGRLAEAEALYRQILAADPQQPDALHFLGVLAHQVGRHDVAIELIEAAIKQRPNSAEMFNNVGGAYLALGRSAEATNRFQEALARAPGFAAAHYNLGTAFQYDRLWADAAACFRKSLQLAPGNVDARINLGDCLKNLGDAEGAVACWRQVLEHNPNSFFALNNLGNSLLEQGKSGEATECFLRALELKPDTFEIYNNLGAAYAEINENEKAIECYRKALKLKPDNAATHTNLGVLLARLNRLDEAVACHRQALQISPNYSVGSHNLGDALFAQGNVAAALSCFRKALESKPDDPKLLGSLGACLSALRQPEGALPYLSRAVQLEPDRAEFLATLGAILTNLGRPDEAEVLCRRAVESEPTYAPAFNNLGLIYAERGQHFEAEQHFRRALSLEPSNAQCHYNIAELLLLTEQFEEGWEEYEWRFRLPGRELPALGMSQWDGEALGERTILLYFDQGRGDNIQFVRYATCLKERGAGAVILVCPEDLGENLRSCAGIDRVVPPGKPLPAFDVFASIMSLPRLLRTRRDTIPGQVPYLFADPGVVERWRKRLPEKPFKVGVLWQGSIGHGHDRFRSVRLTHFEPLAKIPGVQLVSLQVGAGQEQITELDGRFSVLDIPREFDHQSFRDAAGAISNLDLVVSVDSAIAHLAGALGVPTWLALRFPSGWRWLWGREDSPWYPTMKIFRQASPNDWPGVFRAWRSSWRRSKEPGGKDESDASPCRRPQNELGSRLRGSRRIAGFVRTTAHDLRRLADGLEFWLGRPRYAIYFGTATIWRWRGTGLRRANRVECLPFARLPKEFLHHDDTYS